jgi:hypothetical protein
VALAQATASRRLFNVLAGMDSYGIPAGSLRKGCASRVSFAGLMFDDLGLFSHAGFRAGRPAVLWQSQVSKAASWACRPGWFRSTISKQVARTALVQVFGVGMLGVQSAPGSVLTANGEVLFASVVGGQDVATTGCISPAALPTRM